jgi:hypothetical protein
MNSPKTLEISLYWQRHILNTSTNPAQLERARGAIIKLENELKQARGSDDARRNQNGSRAR